MSENVLLGLEQQTNTFLVPEGFSMDADSGVCSIVTSLKEKLEQQVLFNSFDSAEEAETVSREFLVLDFFDTRGAVNQDVEISYRLTRLFHLQQYYRQLKELGNQPTREQITSLQREFGFHPDQFPPSSALRQMGLTFPEEIDIVFDFVQKNTAFVAHIAGLSGTRNVVKRSHSQRADFFRPDGHPAILPREKGKGYETKYVLSTGEIEMLSVDRLQNWFKNGYHHLPTLVPRFLQEAVQILPDLENNTISPELQRVVLFLLQQRNEATKTAPEIVPIYDSLLQAIPKFYDNAITYQDFINQVTKESPQSLKRRREERVDSKTDSSQLSLRGVLKNLFNT